MSFIESLAFLRADFKILSECSIWCSATLTGINLFYDAVNVPDVVNFDSNALSTGVGNAMGLSFITGPSSRRVGLTLKATF